ncbi:MAG: isoprenyl transferase [Desulfovibrio sp.]|nr:isoprenyl transferase [Desulfovibrio sp.]
MLEKPSVSALLPRHLAIIMDGNGRWAQARGLARSEGHRAGAENVRTIVTECRKLEIAYLTLYAFSTENWKRPQAEISVLFSLLSDFLQRELPLLREQNIRLKTIGCVEDLPFAQRTALAHALRATKDNTAMTLNLALNYGGRSELVQAVRAIVREGLSEEAITEESLAEHLYTAGQPDPDCVIRTSGEQRLSNYLLYQSAYSELIFSPAFWPDFGAAELRAALEEYAGRKRRFGRTQEQIAN